ncbi:Co2+/Mg2+ efflux protein ApaG [Alteromonadaceae bacterium BrNp21-10]|nr:Co2+/Mg2+ efflux protein ApaG [Alteromonadaceae bacterium BrNp21-10]
MLAAVADQIKISVSTKFIADHPISAEEKFAFAYFITIKNNGDKPVQLLNRYWLITDGNGKISEVQGAGVVGQQPLIKPTESYQYNSGAILDTPVGTMQGHYEFQSDDKVLFNAPIPVFSLRVPNLVN